jgi:DNA replication protein DnaC
MADIAALSFEDRFGLLVDRELTERDTRRLTTRWRQAKLRQTACIEEIDDRHPRGLAKAVLARLATCQWVREPHNVFITGPTGIGKTWLGGALGHKACRAGLTALSRRLPRFLPELAIAKGDGRYGKLLAALAKTDLLRRDDWGLAPRSEDNRRDVLESVEDRHDCRATLVTSPLPVEPWHEALGDPTWADAILDRLVPNAYQIPLQGASMRTRQARWTRGAIGEESSPAQRRCAPILAGFAWRGWQLSHGLDGRLHVD